MTISAPATQAKTKNKSGRSAKDFHCVECGVMFAQWMGRCSRCGSWGTVERRLNSPIGSLSSSSRTTSRSSSELLSSVGSLDSSARSISDIDPNTARHRSTHIHELDRVLGGGIVPGSAILLAGEPGVGKSTLLLKVASEWATNQSASEIDENDVSEGNNKVLYITAEESISQVRQRADRTNCVNNNLFLASESDLETVITIVELHQPKLVIIDSLQTIQATGVDGVAGGVAHTRAVAATLTALAKNSDIPIIIVGHVTKDGAVAGPRTVEHLVDVVLHFEGDKDNSLRFLRGIKNRFGTVDEVGCFQQEASGICEVLDPSGLFLHHRTSPVPGTAITVTMDGRRALLGEVQTLAVPTEAHNPRRLVTGFDSNRIAMLLAILTQRCRISLQQWETYVATVAGMKISDPSADLAIALALVSTMTNTALPEGLVILGEVGLGGEVRPVPNLHSRLEEAARLGFTQAIFPLPRSEQQREYPSELQCHPVRSLMEAIQIFMPLDLTAS